MYEQPTLARVGKAEEVILGIASFGTDIDGQYVIDDLEFSDDDFEAVPLP